MDVPEFESEQLVVDSCRRLTGPSLVWSETGAILDLLVSGLDMDQVLECWYRQLHQVLEDVAWVEPRLVHRRFENGFNLLLAAPVDQLYSAVLVLETNCYLCACELLQREPESRDALLESIRENMRQELNPRLTALQAAAIEQGVDFLADDETVSLGHGKDSCSYAIDQIPQPGEIDWSSIHDLPVAMITGTNGKSTSVRILDSIAVAAGKVSGITSTDFVRVGDEVLDQGDYSGPGGARLLLRDPRLEVGFLEVARGGILRRGLPLRRARAALVTNIASDHLGQYGVNTLAALTATKLAVRQTLADDGILVVNADDHEIVRFLADKPQQNLFWFSLDKSNPQIQRQISLQQPCCFCEHNALQYFSGRQLNEVCRIDDLPMALGGAAIHNVQNALGAIGVATVLGFTLEQIATGLKNFHSDASDNPGRMNHFTLSNGARVIVDFAHNEHGVRAIVNTVGRMPARQKWVMISSAGDRDDEHIAAIASGVCSIQPEQVIITELDEYLRGRRQGEVSHIMKEACLRNGIEESRIHLVASPLTGVELAAERMGAEDLALFLVLSQREEIISYLESQQA